MSARILDKNGKIIASRLFEDGERFDKLGPTAAVAAFAATFGRIAIEWTLQAL